MAGETLTRTGLLLSVAASALLALLVGLGGAAMGEPYTNTDAAGAALFTFVLGMIVALSLVPKALARWG